LLQRAADQAVRSVVRQTADAFLNHKPQGYWLRSVMPEQSPSCLMLDDGYTGLPPEILGNQIVGITEEGELRVWHRQTGQRLFNFSGLGYPPQMLTLDDSRVVIVCQGENPSLTVWDVAQGLRLLEVCNQGKVLQLCKLDHDRFIASFEQASFACWNNRGVPCFHSDHLDQPIDQIWPLDKQRFLTASHSRVSLWDADAGCYITDLTFLQSVNDLQVKPISAGQYLSYCQDGEQFHIWSRDDGQLLATGAKQSGRALGIVRDTTTRIIALHDTDDMALNAHPLVLRIWSWDGTHLSYEQEVDLKPEPSIEWDYYDSAACCCDSQLFDDGTLLLPSPLSLWSGLNGEQRASLKGSWSLGISLSDFGSYYRHFDDGRLLTWSEPSWSNDGVANTIYLWNRHGQLIREINIDSLFFDTRILSQQLFATFNCDDTLQIWDGYSGECVRHIIGMGGTISLVKMLSANEILTLDHHNNLVIWPLQTASVEHNDHHASDSAIQAKLFTNRILSYSFDNFPPRLWDADNGKLLAVLHAYDSAVGARLEGVMSLSADRFLTWGTAPKLHLYDSQTGQCLASLQDTDKPHIGRATLWELGQDQVLCHLWDGSLRILNLEQNHFNDYQLICSQISGARPAGDGSVVYWLATGEIRLWNIAEQRDVSSYYDHERRIENLHCLSHNQLVIFSSDEKPELYDWKTQQATSLDWLHKSSASHITELSNHRLAIWSSGVLQLWNTKNTPSRQIHLIFKELGALKFVAELPNGHLLTQQRNHRASLWCVWNAATGELLNSAIMSLSFGQCQAAQTIGPHLIVSMTDQQRGMTYPLWLDWQATDQLKFLPIEALNNNEGRWHFNQINKALGWASKTWSFFMHRTGTPIGLIRNDERRDRCEWHGEPMRQLLKVTDDGRVIGFGRKPIILELWLGNQPNSAIFSALAL